MHYPLPFIRLFAKKQKTKLAFAPELLYLLTLGLTVFVQSTNFANVSSVVLFVIWAAISNILIALAFENLKEMLLPDRLVMSVALLSIIYAIIAAITASDFTVILSALGGSLLLGSIPFILYLASKGRWLGFGDVKMAFATGILIGALGAIFEIALIILFTFLLFLAGRFAPKIFSDRFETGPIWAITIIATHLFGATVLTAIF